MTEKEKMAAGLPFDANNDPVLLKERANCKELCFDFNRLRPSQTAKQRALIQKLLGKTAERFDILAPFWCDYGYNIEIGDNFFANHNCVILDSAKVTFGNNVFIGPDCGFYTASHPFNPAKRRLGLETAHAITVGNDVWIGGGVKIMPGVSIGDGSIIGGGSVVTKDIPANVIAVGNPCRVIRKLL